MEALLPLADDGAAMVETPEWHDERPAKTERGAYLARRGMRVRLNES